ncbi:MAG: site-specific integrase [Candidatus Methanoplasma sp.]|nr:site-specific integrase [Candidatus Methanoplasma sp.]
MRRGRAAEAAMRSKSEDYRGDPSRARLGSRPFMAGVAHYMAWSEPYLLESTIRENARKLYFFADELREMKRAGRVRTTDPRHMGPGDIEAFLVWMKRRGLSQSTKRKYLQILDGYLSAWGNRVVGDMRARHEFDHAFKGAKAEVSFIEEEDLRRIFRCVDEWPGYEGIMLRGCFALLFGVAARPKEVVSALVEDVDLDGGAFYIRHPKGEGSWGVREWVPIVRGDMLERVRRFVAERAAYLQSIGRDSPYLFANTGRGAPYTTNALRLWKAKVEAKTGISFALKEFRSSFATITYAHAPEMKGAISKQLRHSKEGTTEQYYIAYDKKRAAERLRDEWKKSEI